MPEESAGVGVAGTARAIRSGERSARAVVDDCLAAIERLDGGLNAFHETLPEHARSAADGIDAARDAGEALPPLAGVPIAVKDNIVDVQGFSTCGSRMLESYRSPFAASAVTRLRAAGAIMIGRTNCDEFAMGSSSEHCAWGAVHNPWDTSRVPGGSSGGSAVAVAAGCCAGALGSDTGGSIRQPAALCGVVGLKPSYGRVSRRGLVAFASSFDQIGPLGTTVEDVAAMLGVLAGPDELDSTCVDAPVPDYLGALDKPLEDLRIGVPRQYRPDALEGPVGAAVGAAVDVYRTLGARIVDLDLPLCEHGVATYYVIAPAEASGNLARFDGIRYGNRADIPAGEGLFELYARSRAEGFGPEVRRRIMLGTWVLSAGYHDAYYMRALRVRRRIRDEIADAFTRCDVILGPTTPEPAFPIGSHADPVSMYRCDTFTTIANISGICAVSLPAGLADVDGTRLPLGVQLQAPAFEEARLLRAARMFERETDHHRARPSLHGARGGAT